MCRQDLGLCEEGDKSLGGLLMLLGLGVVGSEVCRNGE